ncbi:hypothetical protein [Streptomyces sp. NPDC085540]|uniref:hypothetical protein n=1 Tax=Streptomyces sp. NPDC085540 TaxID=3365730 RepID=UPI0037CE4B5F
MTVGDRPLYAADVDLTGPLADWNAHLSLVRDKAVPLAEPLAALLVEITEQLTTTTANAPLAALRAVGVSAETVATALGTTRSKWVRGTRPAAGREMCANRGLECEEFRRTVVTWSTSPGG